MPKSGAAPPADGPPFACFPRWMWRNAGWQGCTDWLHGHDAILPPERRVALRGFDLHSLGRSVEAVPPDLLDAFTWFAETRAVTPLEHDGGEAVADTYPTGLWKGATTMAEDDKTMRDDKAASEHLQDIGSKAADEAGTAGGEGTTGAGGIRSGVQRGGTLPGGGPGAGFGSLGTGGASTGGPDSGNVKRGGK